MQVKTTVRRQIILAAGSDLLSTLVRRRLTLQWGYIYWH